MSRNNGLDQRDAKTGRFLAGNSGNGGRPKGSRNRLTTEFLDDVYRKWQECGSDVLDRVIRDRPDQFLKIVAALMPSKIDIDQSLSISVELAEARTFDQHYQIALKALEFIGGEAAEPEMIESDATAE
jgi:hypothetical protein